MGVTFVERVADGSGVLAPAARAIKFVNGTIVAHPSDTLTGTSAGPGQVTGYDEVTIAPTTAQVSTALATATSVALANGLTIYNTAVTTADATPATLLSFTLGPRKNVSIRVRILATTPGVDSADPAYKWSRELHLSAYLGSLTTADTATIGADVDTLGLVAGSGGVAVSLSSTTCSVRVTGLAGTDITWRCVAEVLA